ncbi:hypothetical protein CGRA01v4_08567 [Colletotrichum graminicola]|nr:hypothetical protein CGRA01v4_08567 [Colletotrichum graminicola]
MGFFFFFFFFLQIALSRRTGASFLRSLGKSPFGLVVVQSAAVKQNRFWVSYNNNRFVFLFLPRSRSKPEVESSSCSFFSLKFQWLFFWQS